MTAWIILMSIASVAITTVFFLEAIINKDN